MKPERIPKWLALVAFAITALLSFLTRKRVKREDVGGGAARGYERVSYRQTPLATPDKTTGGAQRKDRPMTHENRVLSSVLVGLVVLSGLVGIMKFSGRTRIPETPQYTLVGAQPEQAPAAFTAYGCPACHTIQGVDGQRGKVGPKLDGHFAKQAYIAGKLANTPDNLTTWLRLPQKVEPGTAMPNLGVSESAARNMAAYLYSLK